MNKTVFVCGFSQESNSFNPTLTELEVFRGYEIFEGGEAPEKPVCLPDANGMLEFFKEAGVEIKCGVIMRAGSGGPVNHDTVDYFLSHTLLHLQRAGKVDGITVAMHGATVSDKTEDVCGFILEELRKAVGEEVPISASFDLHANITDKVVKNADYVSGFQAYPHLDQKETGIRAAKRLYERLLGDGGKLVKVSIPMIAPAHGYTTTKGALNQLVNRAKALIQAGEIIDYTIFEVQPWLNVSDLQTTVIVIAKDEEKAKAVAADLAAENFAIRQELLGEELFTIEQVIDKALKNKSGKPVVLVDSADSPNAGANADSAAVIEKVLPYRDVLKCAVAVTDVAAVEKAERLGVGAVDDFVLGASIAPKLSSPVLVKNAKVISIHEGTFYLYGPQTKGLKCSLGKTVVLKAGKILIHVSSCGKAEGDLNFYRNFGIEPTECDLVQVKACTSFRAGYEPLAAEICNTDTPGAAGTDLLKLPFDKRPKPLYPFEEIKETDISEAKRFR